MHQTLGVRVRQPREQVEQDGSSLAPWDSPGRQGRIGALHDQERRAVGPTDVPRVEHLHHVAVVQARHRQDLALEREPVQRMRRAQDLDRQRSVDAWVASRPDLRHATRSEPSPERVPGHGRTVSGLGVLRHGGRS